MNYKFSELFSWTSGKPIEPNGGNIPVYGSNGIIGYTDNAKYNNKIILGRVGAYCGSTEYCIGSFNATDNTLITTCDENKITYLFAYYLLKQYHLNDYAGGSAQPLITQSILKHLKCDIPNIETQCLITNIISKYDELIELNNKRIKLLEQTAEELYKEWFVRFHFPNYQNTEFENGIPNGWHFGDETNKKRPKGWEYAKFEKIGSFKRGKNITASEMVEGDIPVISAGIEPSGFHNQSNVQGKSLTLSASGANAGYLKYNLDDIWAADCLYYQNDDIIWFVYNTLKFLQPVISNMQCGAAQPHVYPKNISRLCVVIPPKAIIDEFCKTVSPFYDEIKQLKQQNENLIKQRDLLLPRLMSGKLEVGKYES